MDNGIFVEVAVVVVDTDMVAVLPIVVVVSSVVVVVSVVSTLAVLVTVSLGMGAVVVPLFLHLNRLRQLQALEMEEGG